MGFSMAFQTPITIKEALDGISCREYVLPAIQREFVWSPNQVCRLFDSMMRDYPIGSFLFWKVDADHSGAYTFYDFVLNYHQRKAPHCPIHPPMPGRPLTAVLDGQQRLTALNIGLRGSHAEKRPRLWWNNPDAFPQKKLYLNLCTGPSEDDEEMEYELRFLTNTEATTTPDPEQHWFLVRNVLDMDPVLGIIEYLQEANLATNKQAARTLARLHKVVHTDTLINYYEEKDQDLDKVLNIFIRANSGGTPLSYSDMLLSIATAQWRNRDARETIYGFVDDINRIGQGFNFSKDLVLKAGLVLIDAPDIRFKVTNFRARNMTTLEDKWDSVSTSLQMAAQLLAGFGFSDRTLSANNVLIPVAYYLALRGFEKSYLTSSIHAADRHSLRFWVLRSLVKAGVWGSGLDTLLSALRNALREGTNGRFPDASIESAMARLGKSLRFDEEEIDHLSESPSNVFSILALLYGDINNTISDVHVDHVFPRSRFTPSQLQKAGIAEEQIEEFRQKVNGLPNLQLMEGSANIGKSDKMPMEWVMENYPDRDAREMYLASHDMHDLPDSITEFLTFYEARRQRIAARLRGLLGVRQVESEVVPAESTRG